MQAEKVWGCKKVLFDDPFSSSAARHPEEIPGRNRACACVQVRTRAQEKVKIFLNVLPNEKALKGRGKEVHWAQVKGVSMTGGVLLCLIHHWKTQIAKER